MATVTKSLTMGWRLNGTSLTDLQIQTLFQIFVMPVTNQFTLRSGLIGLGKSRILIANQDQLQAILYQYVNDLSNTQQIIVGGLINQWITVGTRVEHITEGDHAKIRVAFPEEQRALIRKRIQTYIPIFEKDEVPGQDGYSTDMESAPGDSNEFLRG